MAADRLHPQNQTFSPSRFAQTSKHDPMLLSDKLTQIVSFINVSIVSSSFAIFGIVANVINIIVFVKHGFNDTVKLSLCALAVVDLSSLILLVWVGICFNPYFHRLTTLPFDPTQVVYLTGGQARLYFTRVGGWITSLVAFERCLCVLKPIQVKLIFTRNRIVFALVCIFIAAFLTLVPVYYTTRLSWKVDALSNRSYVGLSFQENRHKFEQISFALGVTWTIFAFLAVTSCTIVLARSLIKQSRWRAQSMREKDAALEIGMQGSSSTDKEKERKKRSRRPALSSKDRQAVKTVTFIAAMFIVCFLPSVLGQTLMAIFPEFNKNAKYQNMFFVFWSSAQLFEGFCASANIIVYYKTSTKYKETLIRLVQGGSRGHGCKPYF